MSGTSDSAVVGEVKRFTGFVLRYCGFWLIFFLLCRIAFLGYHASKLAGFTPATLLGIFGYGLYIDLSSSCYLLVLPYLIWVAHRFTPFALANRLLRIYTFACVLLVSLITVADLHAYREYGAKLNAQTVAYLRYPREALASVSSSPLLLLFSLVGLLTLVGMLIYGRLCRELYPKNSGAPRSPVVLRGALSLFFAALIFLGIRGSVGVAPMNPSFAYFSEQQFANHAALNASWNLMYDTKYYFRHKGNSFVYLPDAEMRARVERIFRRGTPSDTEEILTTKRPNIVVFILESWTADVIGALGAEKGITPVFDELAQGGLLFTDFYANGNRSSFGIPAVLAGFPSTPEGSVLNHPLKVDRLPTLGAVLKEQGYATQFHYGGDDRFDDMHAFIVHSGFQKVVDREAFDKKDMNSKWGAQDHVLFKRVIDDLRGERTPFFSALFTLSSHEPFEVPMETVYKGSDGVSLFKNAVHYSDRSLKGFFDKARRESWYKNTLFVFVADHGHTLPLFRNNFQPERYRIPLLLYGDVLKKEYRGVRKSSIGSQSDIAATLLAQLGLPSDAFLWSNNLLNRHRNDYAYYNFNTGFALRTPGQTTVFDNVSKKEIMGGGPGQAGAGNAEALKDAQAYMQYLFGRYQGL
jgi:phosphoglycerol transferase MdoB-like AlkP superfamily enzyme